MAIEIRESQVEDVLAIYPAIAQRVLSLPTEPSLLARQMSLPSGRLDLLFLSGSRLLLVELKTADFSDEFISQISSYRQDLVNLQCAGKLIPAEVKAILLCPFIPEDGRQLCLKHDILPVDYKPEEVLKEFFQRFMGLSGFATLKPSDHGLWNIHLINRVARALDSSQDSAAIAANTGLSKRSIANHLRFLKELRLAENQGGKYTLTELGQEYVKAMPSDLPDLHLSEEQATLLSEFIIRNPFASPTIYGIFSIVEAVFNLSKNTYPVPRDVLIPYFRDHCGKYFQWSERKTWYHGTRMYSNYAIELGLLGQEGRQVFLTPMGIRFILLLQLHKSIQMVDALKLR